MHPEHWIKCRDRKVGHVTLTTDGIVNSIVKILKRVRTLARALALCIAADFDKFVTGREDLVELILQTSADVLESGNSLVFLARGTCSLSCWVSESIL